MREIPLWLRLWRGATPKPYEITPSLEQGIRQHKTARRDNAPAWLFSEGFKQQAQEGL